MSKARRSKTAKTDRNWAGKGRGGSPHATEAGSAEPRGHAQRDEFEYIVIGSGAGGGPVAANLAKAGRQVLLLEAGGDANNPRSRFKYSVPGSNARLDP